MEMKQLEIFVVMARTLSFSRTAEELYFSQSTVSMHISALEKSLGTQLFVRNTKEASLTKEGLDFLYYAKKMLALRDQAQESVGAQNSNHSCEIDIIASTIPAQHLLPEIIVGFRQKWPNVVFRVDQADSQQVERAMRSFRYDFGMMGTLPKDSRFEHFPVYLDELVLVLPTDAALDDTQIYERFKDYICEQPFIMRERGSGTRAEIEALLDKLHVDPCNLQVVAYFPDAHSILLATSRGMGISLVSKNAAVLFEKAGLVRIVEMHNPLFQRQILLLHNKEMWLSPAQQAFSDYARQFYQ